jgi:hypothetical protein
LRSTRDVTAATIRRILDFLFDHRVLAQRNNVLPIPVVRERAVVGFRPGSRSGLPDIEGILPPCGRSLLVEVKTGNDRLREDQQAYFAQAAAAGAVVLVVKDFYDFLVQWDQVAVDKLTV